MNQRPLFFYQNNSVDGFAAAWAAQQCMQRSLKFAEFVGIDYDQPIPSLKGRDVYYLGVVPYDVDALIQAGMEAKQVTIITHTEGAHEIYSYAQFNGKLPSNFFYHYMSNQSACGMAWGYFNPGEKVPMLFQHILDRVLWKFDMKHTREVHATLKSRGYANRFDDQIKLIEKFNEFTTLVHSYDEDGTVVQSVGLAVLKAEEELITGIIQRNMTMARFADYGPTEADPETFELKNEYSVPICECPYELASEIGNRICKGHVFSLTYETQWALGKRRFSIRSDDKTGINVLDIALKYDGGGQPHTAGWVSDIKEELPFDVR
jgi:uncharacterized protein